MKKKKPSKEFWAIGLGLISAAAVTLAWSIEPTIGIFLLTTLLIAQTELCYFLLDEKLNRIMPPSRGRSLPAGAVDNEAKSG